MNSLVCKETVVRRWRGTEMGKFGIKPIAMGQISTDRNVSLVILLWWKFDHYTTVMSSLPTHVAQILRNHHAKTLLNYL